MDLLLIAVAVVAGLAIAIWLIALAFGALGFAFVETQPSPFVEMIERTHPAVAKLRTERQEQQARAVRLRDEPSD